MNNKKNLSLNKRLISIAMTAFVPMVLVLIYALASLSTATNAYSKITQSVTYANLIKDFKERMDYSMYLAVIGKKDFEALGDGETTVNGIVTVNPYTYIDEMKKVCSDLSKMATVDINKNQSIRLHNTLNSLEQNVETLELMINGSGSYDENMAYLDENIYMLTTMVQDGIQDYIRVETTNLYDVSEKLERRNAQVYGVCILISAAAIIISLVLTLRALRSVTDPIRKLCDLTQKVAEGDFTVKSKDSDIDEIAMLAQSFNDMTGEIGNLIEDIKEKQKYLHLMETKLLQAQINPHFLYNTLDTIVWLAEDNQKEEIVTMVTALSEFFRTTLSRGLDFISVKEEELHIESYLKIQRFRYQDIMDYEIRIEPDILQYTIPKLLLQPLVENALYHGVKNKRGKSLIRISGKKEGNRLIFQVTDTGKGMSREVLERVRSNIQKEAVERNREGFGLANINQRIHHYYGEEYGLFIESREDEGTEATILIEAKKIQPFS